MSCWMKCWIGLAERKNNKKRKTHVGWSKMKSCWMKIWSRANLSSNIFRLIQHNFHIGSVYSLFHLMTLFHCYDVISNDRTSNFEWFNKTKTLCKIITIKKITHIKSKWASTGGSEFSSYETELRKMTSHFELLTRKYL